MFPFKKLAGLPGILTKHGKPSSNKAMHSGLDKPGPESQERAKASEIAATHKNIKPYNCDIYREGLS